MSGMLVHICCSVDSSYYIKKLKEKEPDKRVVGFFYDPNIHPYSEYYLRMLDAKRSCQRLGVEFIEGPYDVEGWLEAVRGFEHEPEKGKRCTVCFDDRLERSAQKAVELGLNEVTTTLLMSPKKDFSTLERVSKSLEKRHGITFVVEDFRKGGGTQEQFALSKEEQNYHQNYCGCLFALNDQRLQQGRSASELYAPIDRSVLPGSIEERIALYEKRMELEERGEPYRILREKFQNYRLLRGYVKWEGEVIPSYFLPYAKLPRVKEKGRVEIIQDGVACLNRENIRIVDLKTFNKIANTRYKDVKELIYSGIGFDAVMAVRAVLVSTPFAYSPLVVVDRVQNGKYEILCDSRFYEDTREFLVTLS